MAGEVFDDPNRQAVGLEPAWVEGTGGGESAEPKGRAADDELPGRHAPLDELAAERGHTWSSDDLTVAEKKAELEKGG